MVPAEAITRELIIKNTHAQVEIALLEEGKLVELHHEKKETRFTVGDLFLVKVKRVVSGLNAAFLDMGKQVEGFLHYTDLGPQFNSLRKLVQATVQGKQQNYLLKNFELEPDINKNDNINNVVKKGDFLLVQVLKEPISTKGPRLSCEISFAGRYLVLLPFSRSVTISKKITAKNERKRLESLATKLQLDGFGIIVRTAAENTADELITADLQELLSRWKSIMQKLPAELPPTKIMSEQSKTTTLLRDLLNASFSRIVTDDQDLANDLKNYIQNIAPKQENLVQYYQGKKPIFDFFGVNKQIKASFGKTVNLSGGVYIVIEHTEAMHVIDVNSGHKVAINTDHETNAMQVNTLAAEEVARQLRLRDIGGIIVIDFIDLKQTDNKKNLYNILRDSMEHDRARHTILPLSKFGLIQITRQRVRPEVQIITTEVCPTCNGQGVVEPTALLIDHIEEDLSYLFKELNYKKLHLKVHPFVESHLKKGWKSLRWQWIWKYKRWLSIESDSNIPIPDYHFYDENMSEIEL
ncbi:MAG: Rne/Rng family ribonuclease [Chitinophagales bacterium]|nr:Rne/Rng family ribonuclease [Bacteroidota bacterium]MCB9043549.1 Rne/Rng family ribonuclease [Chitinophagales bacterium]